MCVKKNSNSNKPEVQNSPLFFFIFSFFFHYFFFIFSFFSPFCCRFLVWSSAIPAAALCYSTAAAGGNDMVLLP